MILIFGGTTEGRIAVEVCDRLGLPYIYSTKSALQEITLKHGTLLQGGLTATEIGPFCQSHDIQLIIDAGHPFAENLHHTIAAASLPVIRLQRSFPKHDNRIVYVHSYEQAVNEMIKRSVSCLLALSGVNTIAKMKGFWEEHEAYFRILDRPESWILVEKSQFPENHIIAVSETEALPVSVEKEMSLMQRLHCDAMLTKESGETGGFSVKVEAAFRLGLQVFVIEHPTLPSEWTYVSDAQELEESLRRIIN